jgi:hypothetical protein
MMAKTKGVCQMNIFIDTEFSDFDECYLLSIALVSTDRQFYGELKEGVVSIKKCSNFVIENVIPKLWKNQANIYETKADLAAAVRQFLDGFLDENPVLCFDFEGDFDLIFGLLDCNFPAFISTKNVYHQIDRIEFKNHIKTLFGDGADHHALHDAMANMLSFRNT